jgi:uncharacterized protein YdcH (DUF465 family)
MEQEIRDMIKVLKSNDYDQERLHGEYDELLEKFILNYNEDLVPLMKVLIELEKHFWWA